MSKPLMQVEYKGNPIVEQLIVKQNLYIIVRNKKQWEIHFVSRQ